MKKVHIYFFIFIILILFIPFMKTYSEDDIVLIEDKEQELLYKIEFKELNINELTKLEDKIKIIEIRLNPIGNLEYSYKVKSNDYNLSEVFGNELWKYADKEGKTELLLKNNNINIKYLIVLNTYNEIEENLKKYNYKIVR